MHHTDDQNAQNGTPLPLSVPTADKRSGSRCPESSTCTRYQCGIFPGMSPEAESNPAALRIKYGIHPGISGICPIPAAESKVGYIPLFWRATVASSRCARAPFGQARAPAVAWTPARRFCATMPCTLCLLGHVPSAVWSFPQSARSCRFTLGGVGGRRSQRINLTQAVLRCKECIPRVLDSG